MKPWCIFIANAHLLRAQPTGQRHVDQRVLVLHREGVQPVVDPPTPHDEWRNLVEGEACGEGEHVLRVRGVQRAHGTGGGARDDSPLVPTDDGVELRRVFELLGEIVHRHVEHVGGDLDRFTNLPALDRLVDDFELPHEVWVEENVAVLVAVVGRAVAFGDDLEHGGHHGQVVAVGRETRDGVDAESTGVRDESRRCGEKHTLEGVTILETVEKS